MCKKVNLKKKMRRSTLEDSFVGRGGIPSGGMAIMLADGKGSSASKEAVQSDKPIMSTILSFRAELFKDVHRAMPYFMKQLTGIGIRVIPDKRIPDVVVELTFDKTTAWYTALCEIRDHVDDSHVMVRTARPVSINDNDMERAYQDTPATS